MDMAYDSVLLALDRLLCKKLLLTVVMEFKRDELATFQTYPAWFT